MEKIGLKYCMDTDVLIDFNRGVENTKDFLLDISSRATIAISTVTVVELWAGKNNVSKVQWKREEEQLHRLINNFLLLPVTKDVALMAGTLRGAYQMPFSDL
jgi:predicted nucleic acid-binding protein